VPEIRQFPADSALAHPVVALHVSFVQVRSSSQFTDAPPPVHCPATHVLAAVNRRLEQFAAMHVEPSARDDQAVVLLEVLQAWHGFAGFAAPFATHPWPGIRQWPAFSTFAQPLATLHESFVQACPSSQDDVPPPATHRPAWHVVGAVYASPLHAPSMQRVPSALPVHAVPDFVGSQTWHGCCGFGCPLP
jgi:hypothetical protein